MKHSNIPVFIPHLGCPNNCVFCNQRTISGRQEFDEADVKRQIEEAVSTLSPGDEAEIAFFGGSFTGIDRGLMIRLLETSDEFVNKGLVGSVRCSTRPDYINGEILEILKTHHVKTIELGIQSTDDAVLCACRRGHSAEASFRAMKAVREAGFDLVGQMMVNLPGATPESERATAKAICDAGAVAARVYPTVVFRRTELCDMMEHGCYTPATADEIIGRTADLLDIFDKAGVKLLRVGLCASENLASPEEVAGGAAHPAIGELAMSELFYRRICEGIGSHTGGNLEIQVAPGAVSKAVGQKKNNVIRLKKNFGFRQIKVLENKEILGYNYILSFF